MINLTEVCLEETKGAEINTELTKEVGRCENLTIKMHFIQIFIETQLCLFLFILHL